MRHYLQPLFAPQSVALVGASERPASLGRVVYENLLGGGFSGDIYAVNPKHSRVLAQPAFASLDAIGQPIDLAIVASPPEAVADILANRNIPFAFVTGYGPDSIVSAFSYAPVLQKPIEAAKLHALLQQIVR